MQFKMEPKESIKSLKEPEKGSNRSSQIPETTRRPTGKQNPGTAAFIILRSMIQKQTQVLSVMPSTASSFLRILATNLSRSSAVNSSSPCLKVTVKAILFMVGGIGMPS